MLVLLFMFDGIYILFICCRDEPVVPSSTPQESGMSTYASVNSLGRTEPPWPTQYKSYTPYKTICK